MTEQEYYEAISLTFDCDGKPDEEGGGCGALEGQRCKRPGGKPCDSRIWRARNWWLGKMDEEDGATWAQGSQGPVPVTT